MRDALVDQNLIVLGKGKGGAIRRIIDLAVDATPGAIAEDSGDASEAGPLGAAFEREEDLYRPMSVVLADDWAQDRRKNFLGVEITGRQGRRATGGTWSRPDLVTVEIRAYEYVPGKFLEVVTFEVKPAQAIGVQAVYEALAHRRASTHAYVLLHVPTEQASALESAVHQVQLVARTHGIGLVTAADPEDYATWEEIEEAQRAEPDPDRLNSFIDTQLSDSLKKKIAKALR